MSILVASLLSFMLGLYLTSMTLILYLGSGDPEGRFKIRYALFWPFYLKKIFGRDID